MTRRWFARQVLARRSACFLVLGLAFFVFAAGTLNIAHLLQLDAALILDQGLQALMDGAGRQLVELLASAYVGMAGWLVFKACEIRLVQWLSAPGGE